MTNEQTKAPEAKPALPPHMIALLAKCAAYDAKRAAVKFVVTDMTPAGYGPEK